MFGKILATVAGLGLAGMAGAQAVSGVVDPTSVVAAITGNLATVTAIGLAVLGICVAIVAFKWSKRAL